MESVSPWLEAGPPCGVPEARDGRSDAVESETEGSEASNLATRTLRTFPPSREQAWTSLLEAE